MDKSYNAEYAKKYNKEKYTERKIRMKSDEWLKIAKYIESSGRSLNRIFIDSVLYMIDLDVLPPEK